jgi:hypothetical protein
VQLTAVPEEPEQSEPASASAPIPAGTPPPPITVAVVFGSSESGIFTNTARVNSQDNAGDPQQRSSSDAFHVLLVGAIEQDIYTPNPGWSGADAITYRVFDAYGQRLNQT